MMVIGTPGSLRSPLVATWPIAALLYGNSVLETLPCCEHYAHYQKLIEPSGASVPKTNSIDLCAAGYPDLPCQHFPSCREVGYCRYELHSATQIATDA